MTSDSNSNSNFFRQKLNVLFENAMLESVAAAPVA